jgi:RNA polymerase-binding transcription factor DksA
MDNYKVIQQRLEARLADLAQRLLKVERNRRRETNPLDPDWAEQAATRQNDEVLDRLEADGHQEITALRVALQRLEQGTYGVCVTCEESIAMARLEVMPHATQCITCAEQAERAGHTRRWE